MKTIRIHQLGNPEVMKWEEIENYTPSESQILIRIEAVGVNPVDTYIRSGMVSSPPLPFTPGMDAAGTVEAVGAKITKVKKGDRIYTAGSLTGTYAEFCLCTPEQVYPLPDSLSFQQGAALNVPYATAYRGLIQKAEPKPGESLLIHGASGGVGIAALQWAKSLDLKIVGTAGTRPGADLISQEGAHLVLNHNHPHYLEKALEFTQGKGFDIILEMLANVNLPKDLEIVSERGRIVIIGCRDKVEINPRLAMGKDTSILAFSLMNLTSAEKEILHKEMAKGLKRGLLNPVLNKEFPLQEAPLAHHAVLEPGAYGKITLIP